MNTATAPHPDFSKEVQAESNNGEFSLALLIKPDTDLEEAFKAWDIDNQEYIHVFGWNWSFEKVLA